MGKVLAWIGETISFIPSWVIQKASELFDISPGIISVKLVTIFIIILVVYLLALILSKIAKIILVIVGVILVLSVLASIFL